MYIDKRTLNPFFKKTNSTPQDLLDWVEFLMKECSEWSTPCTEHPQGKYMGRYNIMAAGWYGFYNGFFSGERINLTPKKGVDVLYMWANYVKSDKQPLIDAIKEFKQKYKL